MAGTDRDGKTIHASFLNKSHCPLGISKLMIHALDIIFSTTDHRLFGFDRYVPLMSKLNELFNKWDSLVFSHLGDIKHGRRKTDLNRSTNHRKITSVVKMDRNRHLTSLDNCLGNCKSQVKL